MENLKPIKTPRTIQRKLSLASGLLSFGAFVISGLGPVWGFEDPAKQITETILVFVGAISIFFLGHTTRKETEEENEKS